MAAATVILLTLAYLVPILFYSSIVAALVGVSLSAFIAALIALVLAGFYADDRNEIKRVMAPFCPYITRAAPWGLAGAGIGALLATALPARSLAPPTSPMEVPISGWFAVLGGAVGMAAGVLEVWHERLNEEPEDVQQVVPDESAGESGLRSPEE